MLTPIVKKLVEERIQKLEGNNDYLTRQIQFLAQRLNDYKDQLKTDTKEVIELKSFLSTLAGVEKAARSAATELGETRRGISDPDDYTVTERTVRTYTKKEIV